MCTQAEIEYVKFPTLLIRQPTPWMKPERLNLLPPYCTQCGCHVKCAQHTAESVRWCLACIRAGSSQEPITRLSQFIRARLLNSRRGSLHLYLPTQNSLPTQCFRQLELIHSQWLRWNQHLVLPICTTRRCYAATHKRTELDTFGRFP